MKLNLGSSSPRGKYLSPEWINLDLCKADRIQVRGSAIALPFKDNSFDEIHSLHVIEHLTRDKAFPMIQECHRVLKPGGRLFIECPDFHAIVFLLMEAFNRQDYLMLHQWLTSTFGKNERCGMAHYWGYHEVSMLDYFDKAGFKHSKRITGKENMISGHYTMEPVLLVVGEK